MPEAPTSNTLTLADLKVCSDGEACIQDLMLARELGFARLTDIRKLISRNADELASHGVLRHGGANSDRPGANGATERRGRPTNAYLLNEPQALVVAILAKTERAPAARTRIIQVYMDYRRGRLLEADRKALKFDQLPAPRITLSGRRLSNRTKHAKKLISDLYAFLHSECGTDTLKMDQRAILAYGLRNREIW